MPGKRKKKRRLRCCAQEFVDGTNVYTPPDCMEVLATKYKDKCKVESSTESESDAYITEVWNRSLPTSTKVHDTVNQYLDPYDGDLESTSSESDSGRQCLQVVCSERTSYLSHAIVAVKPYKQSLLTTFPPARSYTELNSTQMETVATGSTFPQSSRESEVLSNSVHELTFATNTCVADPGQKQFGSLELDVLTGSSSLNLDVERDHRLMNMLVLQDPGKHDPSHQNIHFGSEQLLKAAQEPFLEEKVSSKRKLGNPSIEASNDRISKKKSRMIKTEVSNFVLKWSV
ncbi:uncharacterized protein LOC127575529 [Pristis pectinata]|uniref:uncharacterized protein LOC127575529 n=1 Tax=Pristis pectinata TaxID=685728 RepID=UPI00223D05F9|nr:uncharacterized protein LOC127575529 [Pristis pectinata]